jgi:hypothetical protein
LTTALITLHGLVMPTYLIFTITLATELTLFDESVAVTNNIVPALCLIIGTEKVPVAEAYSINQWRHIAIRQLR